MLRGIDLAGVICTMLLSLPVATVIGALLLRTAIQLHNRGQDWATLRTEVPCPSFGRAMAIMLFALAVDLVVLTCVVAFAGIVASRRRGPAHLILAGATALSVVPTFLMIHLSLIVALLPTSFGRAIRVLLVQMLLAFMFTVAVGLIVVVVLLIARSLGL